MQPWCVGLGNGLTRLCRGRRAGREGAPMIITYRQGTAGWQHATDIWLRRKGQRWSVLEDGHWLPRRPVIPTVIVTSHAGMHARCSMHTLRQALPEQQHPEQGQQGDLDGCKRPISTWCVRYPVLQMLDHATCPYRLLVLSTFHSCKRKQSSSSHYPRAWHPSRTTRSDQDRGLLPRLTIYS